MHTLNRHLTQILRGYKMIFKSGEESLEVEENRNSHQAQTLLLLQNWICFIILREQRKLIIHQPHMEVVMTIQAKVVD